MAPSLPAWLLTAWKLAGSAESPFLEELGPGLEWLCEGQWHKRMAGTQPLTPSPLVYYIVIAAPQVPTECHLVITQGRGHGRDLPWQVIVTQSLSFLVCKMGWSYTNPTEFMGGLPGTCRHIHKMPEYDSVNNHLPSPLCGLRVGSRGGLFAYL